MIQQIPCLGQPVRNNSSGIYRFRELPTVHSRDERREEEEEEEKKEKLRVIFILIPWVDTHTPQQKISN